MRLSSTFWFAILAVVLLPMSASPQASGKASGEPEVIAAVAPVFPPMARSVGAKGEVVVEVKINSLGEVESSKAISGHPLLQGTSNAAAKKWKFAPANDGNRSLRITFSFGYRSGSKNDPELTVTFMPPYRVEVILSPTPVDY